MVKVKKACCGFGHRNIFENINDELDNMIDTAIQKGCDVFYTGAMGEFDRLFSSAVRRVKKDHPNIKLICVKPYMTKGVNTDRAYYTAMYDDVVIPDELAGIHYKAAIKARNRWIVDHSDLVVAYTVRDHGGAYEAVRYAQREAKSIIQICKSHNKV